MRAFPKPCEIKKRKRRNHVRKKITTDRRKLEVKCRELTAILVKHRDNYTCQRCGRSQAQGYKIDAAHVLPKGRHPLMQFVMINILALCYTCHSDFWHGESQGLPWFKEKYPERWQQIEIADAVATKVDLNELLIVLEIEVARLCGQSG